MQERNMKVINVLALHGRIISLVLLWVLGVIGIVVTNSIWGFIAVLILAATASASAYIRGVYRGMYIEHSANIRERREKLKQLIVEMRDVKNKKRGRRK